MCGSGIALGRRGIGIMEHSIVDREFLGIEKCVSE